MSSAGDEEESSVPAAAMDPPPQDVLIIDNAVANVDNKNVHAIPLHPKCSKKIKHLKSTFGCLSVSVLNQDELTKWLTAC